MDIVAMRLRRIAMDIQNEGRARRAAWDFGVLIRCQSGVDNGNARTITLSDVVDNESRQAMFSEKA